MTKISSILWEGLRQRVIRYKLFSKVEKDYKKIAIIIIGNYFQKICYFEAGIFNFKIIDD